MMAQDAKNLVKPMLFLIFWSMDDAFRAGVGGGCGPRLKLASRFCRTFLQEVLDPILSTPLHTKVVWRIYGVTHLPAALLLPAFV